MRGQSLEALLIVSRYGLPRVELAMELVIAERLAAQLLVVPPSKLVMVPI